MDAAGVAGAEAPGRGADARLSSRSLALASGRVREGDVPRHLQVPAALVALPVMSVCAAAVAKKFRVRVREGFTVPLNLYTAVVMESGDRKSPVMEDAAEPLKRHEQRLVEETAGKSRTSTPT